MTEALSTCDEMDGRRSVPVLVDMIYALKKQLTYDNRDLFSTKSLWLLMIPIMIEQLLNSLMGLFDTMMVTRVGSEAVSAVSLVDSINHMIIQVFAAIAAGGTVVCSANLGKGDTRRAKVTADQLILLSFLFSIGIAVISLFGGKSILTLIFGSVEERIMINARTYFFFSALSYPFAAHFSSASAIFRAQGNTKTPMKISILSNVLNVIGNAILIFGFGFGVAGAAIATLLSRAFCAITVSIFLAGKNNTIVVSRYSKIRPDGELIKNVLRLGIPSGIENGMFQFGKLVIQSTVSTMGTVAITAQAMTSLLDGFANILPIGMGIGLMTVVGTCIGAGRTEEAKKHILQISLWSEGIILFCVAGVYLAAKPMTDLAGMEREAQQLFLSMLLTVSFVKVLIWVPAFIPAYGIRAAGDVRFSMIVSTIIMWSFRVLLCVTLAAGGMGPMAVWFGMFADWFARSIVISARIASGRWLSHRIV